MSTQPWGFRFMLGLQRLGCRCIYVQIRLWVKVQGTVGLVLRLLSNVDLVQFSELLLWYDGAFYRPDSIVSSFFLH